MMPADKQKNRNKRGTRYVNATLAGLTYDALVAEAETHGMALARMVSMACDRFATDGGYGAHVAWQALRLNAKVAK